MDMLTSSWFVACLCLTALTIGIVAFIRQRTTGSGSRRAPRETATVALVRRRRELSAQLRELAGDGGSDLLKAEARRLAASPGSIDVLEAAVARADRSTRRAELISTRMGTLAGGNGR